MIKLYPKSGLIWDLDPSSSAFHQATSMSGPRARIFSLVFGGLTVRSPGKRVSAGRLTGTKQDFCSEAPSLDQAQSCHSTGEKVIRAQGLS